MTRINVVPPHWLTDQHLLAEHREIPRVITGAMRRIACSGRLPEPTDGYELGGGHVKQFYTRTEFIARRHEALTGECRRRGFSVNDDPLASYPESDWRPQPQHLLLNLAQMHMRTVEQKREPRYCGETVSRNHYLAYIAALSAGGIP